MYMYVLEGNDYMRDLQARNMEKNVENKKPSYLRFLPGTDLVRPHHYLLTFEPNFYCDITLL